MNRRWLLISLLTLAGCGLSERPYTEKRDWPLTVAREGAAPADRSVGGRGRTLLIRSLQAGPGLEARGLQTLRADGSVQTDFYEAWTVPPAQGAEAALRQWLESSGAFAAVLAPGSRGNADWIVEGTLTVLIAEPGRGVARAALSLVVFDQRPGAPKVLAQRRLNAEAPLNGSDAPARVAAMRAALRGLLEQAEQVLVSLR